MYTIEELGNYLASGLKTQLAVALDGVDVENGIVLDNFTTAVNLDITRLTSYTDTDLSDPTHAEAKAEILPYYADIIAYHSRKLIAKTERSEEQTLGAYKVARSTLMNITKPVEDSSDAKGFGVFPIETNGF